MTDQHPGFDASEALAVHRATWDMPALNETRPDIIDWLAERYRVDFDMASQVVVVHLPSGRPEFFETTDVRVAVETLLRRATER